MKETKRTDVELTPEELARFFIFCSYRVVGGKLFDHPVRPEATVILGGLNGELIHEAAVGNGTVNALNKALLRALEGMYPAVNEIVLEDFVVKLIKDGEALSGTASAVEVTILWTDGRMHWQTRGRSEDMIEASWRALLEGFVYKLLNNQKASG